MKSYIFFDGSRSVFRRKSELRGSGRQTRLFDLQKTMKRTSHYHSPPTEASVFHGLASAFLAGLGFTLTNDPCRILSRYRATTAVYRSSRGLSLLIGFEPGDSNSAEIYCGREWSAQQQLLYLSNYYSVLARRLGVDTPIFYELGHGEQIDITMKTMLADLQRTLPVIVPRVTLEDLLCVEREQFGAETKARMRFGPEYLEHVEIQS